MDREGFLEAVKKQYADEIQEAYVECEHEDGRRVDYAGLNTHLKKLKMNAKVEGLTAKDFDDLVKCTLPDAWDKLEMFRGSKAA